MTTPEFTEHESEQQFEIEIVPEKKKFRKTKIFAITLISMAVIFIGWRQWRIASVPDVGVPFDEQEYWAKYESGYRNECARKYMKDLSQEIQYPKKRKDPLSGAEIGPDLSEIKRNWQLVNATTKRWLDENREVILAWKKPIDQDVPLFTGNPYENVSFGGISLETPEIFNQEISVPPNLPRKIRDLMLLEAARLHSEGDPVSALQWQRTVIKLSALVRQIRLHSFLQGTAISDSLIESLNWSIANESIPASELRDTLNLLTELGNGQFTPLRRVLIALYYEMKMNYDQMDNQFMFHYPNLLLGESELFRRNHNLLLQNWLSYNEISASEDNLEWTSFEYGESLIQIMAPNAEQQDEYNIPSAETIQKSVTKMLDPVNLFRGREPAFSMYYPDFYIYWKVLKRDHAKRSLLRVNLALQIYHREHGNFPENLQQLVPDYLAEIPVDSFSNDNSPLSYRLNENYALTWSVGEDQTDDNGYSGGYMMGSPGTDLSYRVYIPGTPISVIQTDFEKIVEEFNKPQIMPELKSRRER